MLATLAFGLLGNLLAGKIVIQADEGIIRACSLILWLTLKYENIIKKNLKFDGVYSRNNLP